MQGDATIYVDCLRDGEVFKIFDYLLPATAFRTNVSRSQIKAYLYSRLAA
jgi:hypothetical protein